MTIFPSPSQFYVKVATKPSDLPTDARATLETDPIKANVILPTLLKCQGEELNGHPPRDHVWVVVYGGGRVKLIAASTDGYMGKYPIFLFSPLSDSQLSRGREPIFPALDMAAQAILQNVLPQRVYSVFGTELLAKPFATLWSQMTGIQAELVPYYLAKISYATRETLVRPMSPNDAHGIRRAVPGDIQGIAELCYRFARDSVCLFFFLLLRPFANPKFYSLHLSSAKPKPFVRLPIWLRNISFGSTPL
jgi:hypothetical protein